MTQKIAIRVNNLSKKYRLGRSEEKYHTFRDVIVNLLKAPLNVFQSAPPEEGFWALKEVSFNVHKGDVVGIIGRNGAGKSTLLKILSRITTPTEGEVAIYGRVGSLLEVGTGFHPELTGRENIFLSGSILGMRKREIEEKFDEIVKFAEIEKFIDTPVKRYSSGMYVRLAFAVAAHMDTEILLVDEVLAVGDAAFQKKCMGKMGDVAQEGRTVLFVSHNMGAISALCNTSILISDGKLRFKGSPSDAIDLYLQSTGQENEKQIMFNDDPRKEICILSVQVGPVGSNRKETIELDDDVELTIKYNVKRDLQGTNIYVGFDHKGVNIFNFWDIDYDKNLFLMRNRGLYTLKVLVPNNFLNLGQWTISVDAGRPGIGTIDKQHHCLHFLIENYSKDMTNSGLSGGSVIAPISVQTISE